MSDRRPILYSFRRCPYAMRARMAIAASGVEVELREVVLRNKPEAMLEASPKGTVPVLQLTEGGGVVDESLDVMLWALERADPEGWMQEYKAEQLALIHACQSDFKDHLDHYKYPNRYEGIDPLAAREAALSWLGGLAERLAGRDFLFADTPKLADIGIFPFVRQFANVDRAWFDGAAPQPIVAWLERCLALEVFSRVMEKYPAWQPGDLVRRFPPTGADLA